MFKVGDVYSTIVDGKSHHPVVIIDEHVNESNRIKAVGFSHDATLNLEFSEEYIVPPTHENGFTFKWEKQTDKRCTSLMPRGFCKNIYFLKEKIGEVKPEGIQYINSKISECFVCDCHITEYTRN